MVEFRDSVRETWCCSGESSRQVAAVAEEAAGFMHPSTYKHVQVHIYIDLSVCLRTYEVYVYAGMYKCIHENMCRIKIFCIYV